MSDQCNCWILGRFGDHVIISLGIQTRSQRRIQAIGGKEKAYQLH